MIKLNLLPYRDMRYAANLRHFVTLLIGAVLLAVGLIVLGTSTVGIWLLKQNARNDYLKTQIVVLDKQLGDIRQLKMQVNDLLAHKKTIEALQTNRSDAAHLLDQLVKLTPEGIYLKNVDETDQNVILQGTAQSSARVSTFVNNINASHWMEDASLVDVTNATDPSSSAYSFTVKVQLPSPDRVESRQAMASGVRGDDL